jgi:crotonobetainyl-CoA hydratase
LEVVAESGGEEVLAERFAGILTITINRPQARNSVNQVVAARLGALLEDAARDADVQALVVTGAGEKAFCAGADLVEAAARKGLPARQPWGWAQFVNHPIDKPVIAAVNGAALGGGLELALACDLVVASETAIFGLPEVKVGLLAAGGGVFRLPEQIPRKIAMEMLLSGDPIDAERAWQLGLVNRIVPPEHLLEEAHALAMRIAANAPLSVAASKRVAYGIVDGRLPAEDENWRACLDARDALVQSEDFAEGVRAFSERRKPVWRAR